MRRTLTPRERRFGAWLLLLALLAMVYVLILAPLVVAPLQAVETEMQTLREQRQHYQRLENQRAALEQTLQAEQGKEGQASAQADLLPGDDPSAVAADLMQDVARRIKDNEQRGGGCVLTQRMPIVPQEPVASRFRQVRLSLDLECAIEPLAVLVQDLESGQPLLFVDELNIRRANNASTHSGSGRLTVHLLVSGFLAAAPSITPPSETPP